MKHGRKGSKTSLKEIIPESDQVRLGVGYGEKRWKLVRGLV